MAFDLVVKNGMIVDGSGLPRYRADIGVKDGKIAEIGRINGAAAKETLNAEGRVVAPGFVDGHTHMDAQIFWDPIGTSSCFQGVTSVVMGNCGFTLAPCRAEEADLVMRNLESDEDISRAATTPLVRGPPPSPKGPPGDDLRARVHPPREGVAAGAHGFSTTRSVNHQ